MASGSDDDGTTGVTFDVSELIVLAQALLNAGLAETDITGIMSDNQLRFLQAQLP